MTNLDMFLEILRPLEGLAAELTFVRLQRDVDAWHMLVSHSALDICFDRKNLGATHGYGW